MEDARIDGRPHHAARPLIHHLPSACSLPYQDKQTVLWELLCTAQYSRTPGKAGHLKAAHAAIYLKAQGTWEALIVMPRAVRLIQSLPSVHNQRISGPANHLPKITLSSVLSSDQTGTTPYLIIVYHLHLSHKRGDGNGFKSTKPKVK